jgi:hypothetical protein
MVRGLDHLVLAARDLDRQAALYSKLGFTVGRRNRHPWGTLNHIIQFPGCFLELIATEPDFVAPNESQPVAQFAGFLARYLAEREGLAMIVLESLNAEADQRDFETAGIAGPTTFFFERTGFRPDGSAVHVAFTLAFARTPSITGAGFFVCQQHFPGNFWNPDLQGHVNGVTGVAAVVLMAEDPLRHAAFLEAYTGGGKVAQVAGGISVATPRGSIEVLTPAAVAAVYGPTAADGPELRFVAVEFTGADRHAVEAQCRQGGVACEMRGGGLVVPATVAHGVALGFGRR